MPTAKRIRIGLYRIVGAVCGCGGDLYLERYNTDGTPISNDPKFRWETFCLECKACDPNGWATIKECLASCEEYFNAKETNQ
jgi:hypothetical protein